MRNTLGVAIMALLLLPVAAAYGAGKAERVHFARGETGATLKGSIKGDADHSYLLGAKAGQSMVAILSPDDGSAYFNIFAPGKRPGQDEAMFIGSTEGNRFEGELPADGDYTIQVYMMRAQARRHETAHYQLEVGISGEARAAAGGDALVAGTSFNATGNIPCARSAGQPMGSCAFGVNREGQGKGMVTVLWPDGGSRVIFFEDGTPMSFDQSQADQGATMKVGQNADLYTVTIGDERFEIPEAVISGG